MIVPEDADGGVSSAAGDVAMVRAALYAVPLALLLWAMLIAIVFLHR